MLKTVMFKRPFGVILTTVYVLVTFFSIIMISEVHQSNDGKLTEISQNIHLHASPQNVTTHSLNISKPVVFCFPGILPNTGFNFPGLKTNFYLSKKQGENQFSLSIALYIFNKVLIH
jgi:hypothetical protein